MVAVDRDIDPWLTKLQLGECVFIFLRSLNLKLKFNLNLIKLNLIN